MIHCKRCVVVFGGFLLVGFILRMGFVLSLPNRPLDADEVDYVDSAMYLVEQWSFEKVVYYHVPPVVPMLYSAALRFTGKSFLAPRIVNCFLFLLIELVVFKLGQELGGELAGLISVACVAIYPYFIFFSGYAMTEIAASLFLPLALLFGIRSVKSQSGRGALLFGLFLALAALTRSAVYLFVVGVPLIFMVAAGLRNFKWLRLSGFAVAGFMLLYVPWSFVNYKYFGKIIMSPTIGSGVMLYQTALRITMPDPEERQEHFIREIKHRYYYPPGGSDRDRLSGDEHLRTRGFRIIKAHLDRYPAVVWSNFKRFWQFYPHAPGEGQSKGRELVYKIAGLGSYGVLFPFMIVGVVATRKQLRHIAVLYGFIGYYTLVHSLLYGKLRYRLPLDPILIVFAAVGLIAVLSRYFPALRQWLRSVTCCKDNMLG